MKIIPSAPLEHRLRENGQILSLCAWCNEHLGTVDSRGARGGLSGGICPRCLEMRFGLGDDSRVADDDLPIQYHEHYPRERSFVSEFLMTFVMTFAIIVAFAAPFLGLAWLWMYAR